MPDFSAEQAADIHRQLASRMISECISTMQDQAELVLWCSPTLDDAFFMGFDISRRIQVGTDLGQRMQHAFESEAGPALLIGTDCPNLDADYLKLALARLEDHDAVVGPAEDGGYGLIGLAGSNRNVFEAVDWGTDKVCAQTCAQLNQQKLNWSLLPLLWDVDYPQDVERYRAFSLAK